MADPRNVAHARKVTQEKKHQGAECGRMQGKSA
jgi:hypothetical protein